jgi:hypothetical protein
MQRFFAFAGLGLLAFLGCANATELLQQTPSQISVDYLNINMPNGQRPMGLVGLHFDANLLPIKDFYTGVGTYGAVNGQQGGFFTLGIDNNYRPHLYGPLYLNLGLYLGGGGARSAQTGGGLMVMPYAGLGYAFEHFLLTLNYSNVNFPTGQISGSQVLLGITLPLDFDYFTPSQTYRRLNYSSLRLPQHTYGAIHPFYVSPLAQMYQLPSATQNLNGQTLDTHLGLIGFEAGRYFSQNFYGAVRTLGLMHGNANGYMNVLLGPGYQLPLGTSGLYSITDVMVGSGGGGEINIQNGFLTEVDTGLAWQITPSFAPKFMIGYLVAPSGGFHTWVYTVGLNYNFGILGSTDLYKSSLNNDQFTLKNWRVSINNQTLFNPQRNSTDTGNINSVEAHLDQFLSPAYFVSYRAAFAYQGQHTGGMAEGMIGLGWQHNSFFSFSRLEPHIAFLLGAMGGGNMSVGGGLIVEPEVGFTYALTPLLGFDVAGGRMMSIQQNLNSNVLTAGLSMRFGEAQKLPF